PLVGIIELATLWKGWTPSMRPALLRKPVRPIAIMTRLLICIPFLVFFALLYPRASGPAPDETPLEKPVVKSRPDLFLALAASPLAGFPGSVPWAGAIVASDADPGQTEPLPHPDILVFLEKCIERYKREVTGYRCTLDKHERVGSTPSGGGRE